MIEIDHEINMVKAIFRSVLGLLIVVLIAVPFTWLTFWGVFSFSVSDSTEAVIDKLDIFILLFFIGLILEIPYRIYVVLKTKRLRNSGK